MKLQTEKERHVWQETGTVEAYVLVLPAVEIMGTVSTKPVSATLDTAGASVVPQMIALD